MYCHLWPVHLYHVFPHYLINGTIFGKKVIKCKMCVLIFSANLSETFLILRAIQQDFITNGCTTTLGLTQPVTEMSAWCGRKVMRLATLCTNRQCCCLPLHMAVRLTPAIDSVQVGTCYNCYAIVESV